MPSTIASVLAATRTWKLLVLAGTLTLKLLPAPSVAVFQVVPPSVDTCTVPVSVPIVAEPFVKLKLTVVAALLLVPLKVTVCVKFAPSLADAALTLATVNAAVVSTMVPVPVTAACAPTPAPKV